MEISDLYYEYKAHVELLYIFIVDNNGYEYILCEISMTEVEFNKYSQEDLYNECLQIAHEMGYKLQGELND